MSTHNTAETRRVQAAGLEFAYRRFGTCSQYPTEVAAEVNASLAR